MNGKKLIAAVSLFALALGLLAWTPARAQGNDLPEQAYISGVIGHAQIFSLSCESRSAADWAAFWGVEINEVEFLNRLPRSDNPNEGFVGDPNDPWGYIPPNSYGVHAEPVANALRSYGLDAHAGIGLSWEEIQAEVAAGRPVIVWVIGSIWTGSAKEYETEDGQTVRVANNEHTMILIGYDETRVHLVDALTGYTLTHTLENFLNSWGVLGNMAIVGAGSGENPNKQDAEQETSGENTYTVQPGDTLNKVAQRLDYSWEDLAAWNNISYPFLIYPGQVLLTSETIIDEPLEPTSSGETYTVRRGDYLSKIARDYELDWKVIAELNELTPPYLLYPGQVLQLPSKGEAAPEEETQLQIPATYTASRSESLFALAHYYDLNWIDIAAMNNLGFPYILAPGQTIQLR